MHTEFDGMPLPDLVEMLHDLEGRRTPVGWTPDDAVQKAAIERRIIEVVAASPAGDEATGEQRLTTDLTVKLRSKEQSVKAGIKHVGTGGVFVSCEGDWIVGTHVELQVRGSGSEEHGLRVRGKIYRVDDGEGVCVSFDEQPSDAHERRLRRFILELMRHRVLVN
jgi:hypothetical protein